MKIKLIFIFTLWVCEYYYSQVEGYVYDNFKKLTDGANVYIKDSFVGSTSYSLGYLALLN